MDKFNRRNATSPESVSTQSDSAESASSDASPSAETGGEPLAKPRVASARRVASMRLLAVLFGLAPFVAIELCMRPFVKPAADLVDVSQLRPLFELDAEQKYWEIPSHRSNFFQSDRFLVEKPEGSRRIFVLGGSTVQGRPFSIETSFATWLKLRLKAASPGDVFEVVNCGGVSYASYRVARVLDEVLRYEPDAVVIYTGHNEFLEDREYPRLRRQADWRAALAWIGDQSSLVTWIRQQSESSGDGRTRLPMEVDARLDHVGGLDKYQRDPAWTESVQQHFASTLASMVEATKAAGVPLVLCTPASDLVNTPPFKSQSWRRLDAQQRFEFEDAWSAAQDAERSDAERLSACSDCLRLDPNHAGANYLAGRLNLQRGRQQRALAQLRTARDHDVCPLRATDTIVGAVREIADRFEVPLVETTALLDRRNFGGDPIADGVADPELFLDHVHPSVLGHQLIGADVASQIEALGWYRPEPGWQDRHEQLVKEHLAGLTEAYFARGAQRLEGLRNWAAGRATLTEPGSSNHD